MAVVSENKRTKGPVAQLRYFLIVSLKGQLVIPPEASCLDHRDMVCTINKQVYLPLLHTKYKSSRPCGFRKEHF